MDKIDTFTSQKDTNLISIKMICNTSNFLISSKILNHFRIDPYRPFYIVGVGASNHFNQNTIETTVGCPVQLNLSNQDTIGTTVRYPAYGGVLILEG